MLIKVGRHGIVIQTFLFAEPSHLPFLVFFIAVLVVVNGLSALRHRGHSRDFVIVFSDICHIVQVVFRIVCHPGYIL